MLGGVIDSVTNTVQDVLDAGEQILNGELPTKRQAWSLLEAGMTVAGIAELYGIGEDVVTNLLEEGA